MKNLPTIERFMQRVNKTDRDPQCWEWIGSLQHGGYGQWKVGEKTWKAHRLSYLLANGHLDPNLEIDHLCRNRKCVNPAHLEQVTKRENCLRGNSGAALNAKKTHCVNGHEFSTANTYFYRGKFRQCKLCGNIKSKRQYDRYPVKPTRYKHVFCRGKNNKYFASFSLHGKAAKSPSFDLALDAVRWRNNFMAKVGIK